VLATSNRVGSLRARARFAAVPIPSPLRRSRRRASARGRSRHRTSHRSAIPTF